MLQVNLNTGAGNRLPVKSYVVAGEPGPIGKGGVPAGFPAVSGRLSAHLALPEGMPALKCSRDHFIPENSGSAPAINSPPLMPRPS